MGGGLTQLIGADGAYAGITEICRLNEKQSYRLAVCIPMADYQRLVLSGDLQMLLIGLFITFFVVFCCIYFHRHILSPAFRQLEEDRRESRRRMDELQMERQQMQTELSRLADVCRNESVPDAFQTFVAGIPTLTKTERRILTAMPPGCAPGRSWSSWTSRTAPCASTTRTSTKSWGSAPSSSCSSSWRS